MIRSLRVVAVTAAACVFAAWAGAEMGAQQVGRAPLEIRVIAAPAVATALGRTHLVWEVHMTNLGASAAALERLAVTDEASRVLGQWTGPALRQRVMVVGESGGEASAPIRLAPGGRAIAFMWLTLDATHSIPISIAHQLSVRGTNDSFDIVSGTSVPVATVANPHLRAPVAGGPWVAVRGPSASSGHRLSLVSLDGVVRVPQRFAVDWVRLGDDGRLFEGQGTDVREWFSYDLPVLAVADGTVSLVRDGMADTAPRSAVPAIVDARDAPGNVVVIDIGLGRYATYAHLKRGSILVKEGEAVRTGDPIARIGNSGNSLGPHLHFHVADAVEPLGGEGAPFAIERLQLVGRIPGLAPMLAGTPWTPQANQPARVIEGETPLENMVVRFDAKP